MMNCRKCQKEYIPKREGGFFCSDSCGNSYRQQNKRNELKKTKLVEQGKAVENPLTDAEQELWAILSKLGGTARQLNFIANLPNEDAGRVGFGPRLLSFVTACMDTADNPLVQQIGVRVKAQQEMETRNKDKQ